MITSMAESILCPPRSTRRPRMRAARVQVSARGVGSRGAREVEDLVRIAEECFCGGGYSRVASRF